MDYYQYSIATASPEWAEIVMAELGDLPFDTFEETPRGLEAYIQVPACDDEVEEAIATLQLQYNFTFERKFIPHQNWNAVWESNFQPIIVDDFCSVRASFHAPIEGVKHDLVIDPKMTFGTGHHETTYMMMQWMEKIDFSAKKVFDYGCGTGILAILAEKLGATAIDAVDIERPSYESTIENAEINACHTITTFHGTLDAIKTTGYDVILANINRNVILASLPRLAEQLTPNGILLLSGILQQDEDILREGIAAAKLKFEGLLSRGKWLALKVTK